MVRARRTAPAMVAIAALLGGGCGAAARSGSSHSTSTRPRPASRHQVNPTAPPSATVPPGHTGPAAPPAPGSAADLRTTAVIKDWADALRRGDVRGAAGYFEIPSVFAAGPDQEVTIHTLRQAEAANAALPCGARLISVMRLGGPLVQALFRLTGRPGPGGSACSPGAGETARTNFVIRSGRIRVWLRAPDQPGDNASPSPSPSPGSAPSGPVI